MFTYVYKITNLINGKMYIGQHSTKNINDGYMGSGSLLLKAYAKYGKENFKKEIIAFVNGTKEELDFAEIFFIKHCRNKFGKENLYNLADGGGGSAGFKLSEEQRKRQAESVKKTFAKPEVKEKFSKLRKGKKSGFAGKHHSEETKNKIGAASKGNKYRAGMPSWNKGLKGVSKETSEKMSNAQKGKKMSEEAKKKIGEASKRMWTDELRKSTKERMKKWSEEYKKAKLNGYEGNWNTFQAEIKRAIFLNKTATDGFNNK